MVSKAEYVGAVNMALKSMSIKRQVYWLGVADAYMGELEFDYGDAELSKDKEVNDARLLFKQLWRSVMESDTDKGAE